MKAAVRAVAATATTKAFHSTSILTGRLPYKVILSVLPAFAKFPPRCRDSAQGAPTDFFPKHSQEAEACEAEVEEECVMLTDTDVYRCASPYPSATPLRLPVIATLADALGSDLPSPSPLAPLIAASDNPSVSYPLNGSDIEDCFSDFFTSNDDSKSASDLAGSPLVISSLELDEEEDALYSEIRFVADDSSTNTEDNDVDQFPRSTPRAGDVRSGRKHHKNSKRTPLLKTALKKTQKARQWEELGQEQERMDRCWAERVADPKWVLANEEDLDFCERKMKTVQRWEAWKALEPNNQIKKYRKSEFKREKASQQAQRNARREALVCGEDC